MQPVLASQADRSETSGAPAAPQDALALLRADHRKVAALFADALGLGPDAAPADRSALLSRLGALLQAHTQVELELFYPALAADEAMVNDARAEHAEILLRLERLAHEDSGAAGSVPAGGTAAAGQPPLLVLAQIVAAHVEDEERQLFPAAGALDMLALGEQMAVRRAQLLGDQGFD